MDDTKDFLDLCRLNLADPLAIEYQAELMAIEERIQQTLNRISQTESAKEGQKKTMYFSYDPEKKFKFHATKEEAEAEAFEAFQFEKDNADEGWSDAVENICWGKVQERVTEISRKPSIENSLFDEDVEYELKEVQMKKD